MKRTPLKRVGFKAKNTQGMTSKVRGSTLSRSKPLKPKNQGTLGVALARTIINKVSDKQKARNAEWAKAKRERENLIIDVFGYVSCEWCKKPRDVTDGHHNDWNRAHSTVGNCRLVHRICHTWIHDHNVRDVKGLISIASEKAKE